MNIRIMIGAILLGLIILGNHDSAIAATSQHDIHVYSELELYFHGIEDRSGTDGMYDNGTSYIPKAIIYADTTYVPIRYFANMLEIDLVGWDGGIPLVWVNSAKPVIKDVEAREIGITVEGTMWTDQNLSKSTTLTILPSLKLYFDGIEDTTGANGLFNNGLRDIPKSLIYSGSTYVPLRYFATQLGIPNEQVGWDPKGPKLWIGAEGVPPENPIVTIEMDSGAQITIELYPDQAPNTVANFISLINDGFYDGLIFHRVIPQFMIQGGDPDGRGTGGPGYTIAGEFAGNRFIANDVRHVRGVISMARTDHPDSAGSQFFIMVDDAAYLNGQYAAFGKVIEGMKAVDQIVATPRDVGDKPLADQTIKTITVDTFGHEYGDPVRVK